MQRDSLLKNNKIFQILIEYSLELDIVYRREGVGNSFLSILITFLHVFV